MPVCLNADMIDNLGERSFIFIITDRYDQLFLDNFTKYIEKLHYNHSLDTEFLFTLNLSKLDPSKNIVVLLDPNWGPTDNSMIDYLSVSIVSFIMNGGVVIATFNGAVMLKQALTKIDAPLRLEERNSNIDKNIELPPGYNPSKYGFMEVLGPHVHSDKLFYKVRLGKGLVEFLPLNIVWAYLDTGNNVYLNLLLEAMNEAYPTTIETIRAKESLGIALTLIIAGVYAISNIGEAKGTVFSIERDNKHISSGKINNEDILKNSDIKLLLKIIDEKEVVHLEDITRISGKNKKTVSWQLYLLTSRGILSSLKWKNHLYYHRKDDNVQKKLVEKLCNQDEIFHEIAEKIIEWEHPEHLAERYRIHSSDLEDLKAILSSKNKGSLHLLCKNANIG